jgi:hypothetical protein
LVNESVGSKECDFNDVSSAGANTMRTLVGCNSSNQGTLCTMSYWQACALVLAALREDRQQQTSDNKRKLMCQAVLPHQLCLLLPSPQQGVLGSQHLLSIHHRPATAAHT